MPGLRPSARAAHLSGTRPSRPAGAAADIPAQVRDDTATVSRRGPHVFTGGPFPHFKELV